MLFAIYYEKKCTLCTNCILHTPKDFLVVIILCYITMVTGQPVSGALFIVITLLFC